MILELSKVPITICISNIFTIENNTFHIRFLYTFLAFSSSKIHQYGCEQNETNTIELVRCMAYISVDHGGAAT